MNIIISVGNDKIGGTIHIDEYNRDKACHIDLATCCFALTISEEGSSIKVLNK